VVLVAVQLSVPGSYLPPVFKSAPPPANPTPDDHFIAGQHRRVSVSGGGCVSGAGRCPTIGARIVSPAGVKNGDVLIESAPDNHLTAGPHSRVKVSGSRCVGGAGCGPCVGAGIIPSPGVKNGFIEVWRHRPMVRLYVTCTSKVEPPPKSITPCMKIVCGPGGSGFSRIQ
jgi:hypothetical protein